MHRDYFTGSRFFARLSRAMECFSRKTDRWPNRAAAWIGWEESPYAFFAAAIAANGLILLLAGKEIPLWGAVLRAAGLAVALIGFFFGRGGSSVRDGSFLMRLIRR